MLPSEQAGMPSAMPFGDGSGFGQQQEQQQQTPGGASGGYSGMQLGDQFDAAAQV
jgi:hypothetical protein